MKNAAKTTVLVTGAAGTVGAYIIRELVHVGHRVIAADRPGSRWELEGVPADLVEVREGDLTDLAFAVDAVRGANVVIHTAATIDLAQPYEVQAKINVDAVRYLYEAGRATGIKRFVHFSSGSIYRKTNPIEETAPFDPQSAYERTKVEAERYLWSRPRTGPEVTILRPTMIYGPRARFLAGRLALIPPMIGLLASKIPQLKGIPSCNWIHAEDVARAAVFLAFDPRASWEAYNVADDTPVEFGDVISIIARCYGFELGREVRYPRRLMGLVGPILAERETMLKAATLASERIWNVVVERFDLVPATRPGIDREALLYGSRDVIFANAKLRALGFEFKYKSIAEGYPSVLRWFQEQRWVPSYAAGTLDAWGAGVGFRFDETMAGTWRRAERSGDARPFRFSVTARAPSARKFAGDGLCTLDGRVDAEGLAHARPLSGTLEMSWRRRQLVYEFSFAGDDGASYRFSGQKDVKLLQLIETMTTLPGRILDAEGREVGTAVVYFDLRHDLLSLLGSFQVVAAQEGPAPAACGKSETRRPAAVGVS